MNVLALLDNELKNKNWSMDEKKRHLYLRSCAIFSYDPRYFLCVKLTNGSKLQEEIRNQTVDLENVSSTWTVCTSFARDVYSVLLKELLQEDCKVNQKREHSDVTLTSSENTPLKADPTYNWDYTRVKMGLSTRGYLEQTEYIGNFEQKLKKQDQAIGYIKEEYKEHDIKRQVGRLYQEWNGQSSDDFIIHRMNKIKEQIDTYSNIDEFTDLKYCITNIQRDFLQDDYWTNVSTIPLYKIPSQGQELEKDWELINLYAISLKNDMLYYSLAKEDNKYTYKEITKSDAISYTNHYEGKNKTLIYHM